MSYYKVNSKSLLVVYTLNTNVNYCDIFSQR